MLLCSWSVLCWMTALRMRLCVCMYHTSTLVYLLINFEMTDAVIMDLMGESTMSKWSGSIIHGWALGRSPNNESCSDENLHSQGTRNFDGYISFYPKTRVGTFPTLLTSRLGVSSDYCSGFCFDFERLDILLPCSLYKLGRQYTLDVYQGLVIRVGADR